MFKSKLKEVREAKGISINKMCKDLGLDWHTVDRLEKGDTERISISTLKSLCAYLSIPINYIIDFEYEKKMMRVS